MKTVRSMSVNFFFSYIFPDKRGKIGQNFSFAWYGRFFFKFFILFLMRLSQIIPYNQCHKTNASFGYNEGQHDHWSNHITVSSTLLCPSKYLPLTFHLLTCCGRIMLRLWSTSVVCINIYDVLYFSPPYLKDVYLHPVFISIH